MFGNKGEITQAGLAEELNTHTPQVLRLLDNTKGNSPEAQRRILEMKNAMKKDDLNTAAKLFLEMMATGIAPQSVKAVLGLFGPRV